MRSLIIIILASYAVKCDDDASYYVVKIPEEFTKEAKPFRVYWNVPTMQCKSKKIPFENLHEKFGIIQNTGDNFRGNEISILYDPGVFPALLMNETSGKFKLRNGGVPQEGDLERHWNAFRKVLEQSIPDPDFSGIGIIDFESWRPVFRQNFGILSPYREFSYQIERKQHWFWPEKAIQAQAKQRFEEAARSFMQTTLVIAKKLRPFAKWGYYAFPYCFNMSPSNSGETCVSSVREENDKINWLWQESTALYPSTYFLRGTSARDMARTIRGRVAEAARLTKTTTPILPYFWFRFRDGEFLPQKELDAILGTYYNSSASGFIVWGSSKDVKTVSKCQKLLKYTEEVLGPAIAKYTKLHGSPNFNKVRPVTQPTESGITTWRPILRDQFANKTNSIDDNTFHSWYALHNNTQEIHKVEHETNKRNSSFEDKYLSHIKRNTLLELLFNILLFKEMSEKHNETIDYDEADVLPQNSSSNQNLSLLTTESILSNANDAVEMSTSVSNYTTIDPLNFITAKNEVINENDNGHTNLVQNITQYVNQNDNFTLNGSEFSLPYNDDNTSKLFSSVVNDNTLNTLNIQTSNQSLQPLFIIIKLNKDNINQPKNSTYVKFLLNTFKNHSLAKNISEDEYNIIEKTEALHFAANCSNQSVIDLIPETNSQTDRSSGKKHDSVNTITSIDYNFSTESILKLHQTSTPATIEIPSTIITTTDTDAIVELTKIKDIRNDNKENFEENTGLKTSVTNDLVTTTYSDEDVTNQDPCLRSKNEKKGNNEGGSDVHYSITDSSPIPLNNNESKISLLQTKNEKEDHPKNDTISTINSSKNDEVTSEFSFLQTKGEKNYSYVDAYTSILPTDSTIIPISNNEITSKDLLLQSKMENKRQHMIFTSDPIPITDSISFSSVEVTSKEMVLESSTTLVHNDEINSLTTTGYHEITIKFEDSTYPIVKLEEKNDIDDEIYDESEVGERLLQSDSVIQTKYVHSSHGNRANNKKDDSKVDLRKDMSKNSTNNIRKDHSRNEVISATVLTTDSIKRNDYEENYKENHIDATSSILPTDSTMILISNNEITSKEMVLESSNTLEHNDEIDSLTTTDYHQITTKIKDSTDPLVKLEEKIDIDDEMYDESEVGERLSRSNNVIQTKYVHSSHGNLANNKKDDCNVDLKKHMSENSTNNIRKDHSRNEVISTTVLTTDSLIRNNYEENYKENTGSKTPVTNLLVTTSYSNEDGTNKYPCVRTKDEQKGYHEGGSGAHYSTTDSSPIPLNNNESKISLLQTKNEKKDHAKYDTISSINIITPLKSYEVFSKFSFLQTEGENNNSHVDATSSILPTNSITIPISNSEITSKDSLLQSKKEKKRQHILFTSDPIPTTDSITFGSDEEVTSKELLLESSTTLEHNDKIESLTTIDFHHSTTKIVDLINPLFKLNENVDISDNIYEESEMGERLSQSINVIQTKTLNEGSQVDLRNDLSESSTNNIKDHSRNAVIPSTILTSDSVSLK